MKLTESVKAQSLILRVFADLLTIKGLTRKRRKRTLIRKE